MGNSGKERRGHHRVERHCIIRFTQTKPRISPVRWDVSTVRDMSKTGLLFYTSHRFQPGSELEIKLKTPLRTEESTFWATVIRCKPTSAIKGNYEIAVTVSRIDAPARAVFNKTIEFFIRKN